MKKEVVKTAALISLVTLSFLLFFNISLSGNFSGQDYGVLTNLKGYSVISRIASLFGAGDTLIGSDIFPVSEAIMPDQFVLTQNNQRRVIRVGSESYEDCYANVLDLLTEAGRSNSKLTSIDAEEWFRALRNNSIFIDYGNGYDRTLWLNSFHSNSTAFSEISSVKEVVLSSSDTLTSRFVLYLCDYSTGNYYKLIVNSNYEKVDSVLSLFAQGVHTSSLPYAFELRFHETSTDSNISRKVVLTPQTVLSLSEISFPQLSTGKPDQLSKDILNQGYLENILDMFRFNKTTLRKYVELNDTVLFVDNYSSFKLSPTGHLDFHSIHSTKGIPLFDPGSEDELAKLAGVCYSFAKNVTTAFGIENVQLQFACDIQGETQSSYTVTLDYIINGSPIYFTDSVTGKLCHAIEMQIDRGTLTSYQQYIRSFSLLPSTVSLSSIIKAFDSIPTDSQGDVTYVTNIYTGYLCGAESTVSPVWCITEKDQEEVEILNQLQLN